MNDDRQPLEVLTATGTVYVLDHGEGTLIRKPSVHRPHDCADSVRRAHDFEPIEYATVDDPVVGGVMTYSYLDADGMLHTFSSDVIEEVTPR